VNIHDWEVCPVCLSHFICDLPDKSNANPSVILSTSRVCPVAIMIWSASMVNDSSLSTGFRRPLESNAPSFIRTQNTPETFPFSVSISFGLVRVKSSICSFSAASISSVQAGISSWVRRYTMLTFSAPKRTAVRAASIAAFPPPTTIIFLPTGTEPRRL